MTMEYLLIKVNARPVFGIVKDDEEVSIIGIPTWVPERRVLARSEMNKSSLVVGSWLPENVKVVVSKGKIERINVNPVYISEEDEMPVTDRLGPNKIYKITNEESLRVSFSGCVRSNDPTMLYLRHGMTGVKWGEGIYKQYCRENMTF